jgi:hypothetical protein
VRRTITGTDDRGVPAQVIVDLDEPVPKAAGMLVGATVDPTDYGRLNRLPGAGLCRVFGKPTAGIPSWKVDPRFRALPKTVTPAVSFKDWPSDVQAQAAINSHLDALPADRHEWLIFDHEPEPGAKADPLVYRHRWQIAAATVRAHPASSRVTLVPTTTLQWTVAHGGGDPFTWWAGMGDFAGMDCYADSWRDVYPDPAIFLAPALRLADGVGRPLAVPELGAIRMPSDPTGAKRADWIRAVVTLLRREGCAAVAWWDKAEGTHDFRLDDAASRAAWADVIAGKV